MCFKSNKLNGRNRIAFSAILRSSSIENGVSIGRSCEIVGSSVGRYTYISADTKISNAKIGHFCSIGRNVVIGPGIHPVNFPSTHPIFYSSKGQCADVWQNEDKVEEKKDVEIGSDVWIGINVVILDGVKIGDGAVIAAGAIVNKDVESYAIVGGVPARILGHRFSSENIEKLKKINWWYWSDNSIKNRKDDFLLGVEYFINKYY